MTVKPAAITYKDAASCYDRLVEPMTNIALRSLGAHPSHLHLHSAVHSNMRYHIKTANGIVKEYCQHNPPHDPFWGAGQGACDAVARCTAVSSCLFHAYQAKCTSLILTNPTESSTQSHSLLAFVDDATTTIPLPPTPTKPLLPTPSPQMSPCGNNFKTEQAVRSTLINVKSPFFYGLKHNWDYRHFSFMTT